VKILLGERFQRDLAKLSAPERARCLELLLAIPKGMGRPHEHSGLGVRKLHASGIYEARLGLELRLVFALRADQLVLVTVGTHDEVRRYLASV